MELRSESMDVFLNNNKYRTFIIAEIGTNHNGDFDQAKGMISKAAKAGVDAVKFQTYKTENLIKRNFPSFPRAKTLGYETQFDRFKDLEFSKQQFSELADVSQENNVVFISTPFDKESVDLLASLAPAFKIASGDLINIQLIRYVASKKTPVILSTGQASVEEIDRAVSIFSEDQLALLHCVSSYPTPDDEVNLRSIVFLQKRFGLPVGYSDHSIGILACIAAVAMGARIIEKHFTLDKTQKFGDHQLSADPDDLRMLVTEIRRLEKMLGAEEKICQPCEMESKMQLRRSLHITKSLKAGSVLTDDNMIPLISEENGIMADGIEWVVGKKLRRNMEKGEILKAEDVE